MARKALAATKKARLARDEKNQLMVRAVLRYQGEQAKLGPVRKRGLRMICKDIEKEFFKEKGRAISLNHNTLRTLANGERRMRVECNAEKGWLLKEEAEEVIRYTIEITEWVHGFSHRRLKEHVDEILHARLGHKFPETGVGIQWTQCFVEKHSDQLHVYASRALDTKQGQAVNEHANKLYFDLVEDVQLQGDDGQPIAVECTWAMDESGFQANGDEGYECVIGPKGKKVQYQQQDGTRENITVLVTIGANGTALPPAVIYRSQGYLVKWLQNNPAKAS